MCRDRLRPGWRELPRAHGREPAHGGGAAGANRHRRGGLCRAGGRIGAEPPSASPSCVRRGGLHGSAGGELPAGLAAPAAAAWLTAGGCIARIRHVVVLPTPYSVLRTSHSVLPTPHSVLRTSHSVLRTPYSVLRTSHSVLPTPYFPLRTSHSVLPTPYFPLRTSHSVLPTPYSALLHANTTQVVAMYLTPASSRFARCSCVQKGGNSTSLPRSGRTLKCW